MTADTNEELTKQLEEAEREIAAMRLKADTLEKAVKQKQKVEAARLKKEAKKAQRAWSPSNWPRLPLVTTKQGLHLTSRRGATSAANLADASKSQSGATKRKIPTIEFDPIAPTASTPMARKPRKPPSESPKKNSSRPAKMTAKKPQVNVSAGKRSLKTTKRKALKKSNAQGSAEVIKADKPPVQIGFSNMKPTKIWNRAVVIQVEELQMQSNEFQATVEAELKKPPGSLEKVSRSLMKDFQKGLKFHKKMLKTAENTQKAAYSALLPLPQALRSKYLSAKTKLTLSREAEHLWNSQSTPQVLSENVLLSMFRPAEPSQELRENLDLWMPLSDAIPGDLKAHKDEDIQ